MNNEKVTDTFSKKYVTGNWESTFISLKEYTCKIYGSESIEAFLFIPIIMPLLVTQIFLCNTRETERLIFLVILS